MVDWTGEKTVSHVKYKGKEVHLQGLYRGFGIERTIAGAKQGPYYYFLGNPHTSGAYTADTSDFYTRLLTSVANRWALGGTVPTGEVDAPGGVTANYRGTTLWNGA